MDNEVARRELSITIICKKNIDLKKTLPYKEGKIVHQNITKRKWFTLDGSTKLYYSEQGNKKIEDAF